jgi:hypothetical protein
MDIIYLAVVVHFMNGYSNLNIEVPMDSMEACEADLASWVSTIKGFNGVKAYTVECKNRNE